MRRFRFWEVEWGARGGLEGRLVDLREGVGGGVGKEVERRRGGGVSEG